MALEPITELNAASGLRGNLAQWLASYFDGNAHTVGSNAAVAFPKGYVVFDEGDAPQPITGSGVFELRVMLHALPGKCWPNGAGHLLKQDKYLALFMVSAKAQGEGQSEYLANAAADLLAAILASPAETLALLQNGIRYVVPRGPDSLRTADMARRVVTAEMAAQYTVAYTAD
jgi:hypothetical protein